MFSRLPKASGKCLCPLSQRERGDYYLPLALTRDTMMQNLRAISWLTFLTLLLCSVLYPLTLWAIAQTPFLRHQAEGSLLRDADQKPAGSRLIAQAFNGDEYFQ